MPDEPARPPALTELAACRTRGDFGQLLSRLRRSAGRSIREVSAATRIPVATLGDYFNGKHLPPARDRTLERILEACGVTGEEAVQAWLAALERVRVPPGRPAAGQPAPYRGLAFFRTEDADWFFGRAELSARLAERAGQMRARGLPLVVTGPSGAGKSSLLRAGLIPRLGPGTQAIVFTPGPQPAQALAAALRAAGRGTGAAGLAGDPGLAIIVDQFEEVFAPGVTEDERDELIETLYAAAQPGPRGATLVVLGLRADRYGRALADPRLARSLQDGQVVVGPMTVEEIQAGHGRAGPQGPPRPGARPGRPDAARTAAGAGPPRRARPRRAAVAVARPAGHLGRTPLRAADHRRLPGQRGHHRRGGPVGRHRLRRAHPGPAAGRAAAVPAAGVGLRRWGGRAPPGRAGRAQRRRRGRRRAATATTWPRCWTCSWPGGC